MILKRAILKNIMNGLRHFPIIGLLGPRQVGKTTLAKEILARNSKAIYLDLENEFDLIKLQTPSLYFKHHNDKLIIIDEIQRKPELFPILRSICDQTNRKGQFLILGSASLDLIKNSAESLAGRIFYYELHPFNYRETKDYGTLESLWLRGGFPDSFLTDSEDISLQWRQGFIRTYLERDIPQLGIKVSSIQLQKFWTMLSHIHGQILNASHLASGLGISVPTVKHYLNILEDTFIIRQLLPYSSNIKKRLIKSPKIYIRDSGLLHSLQRIYSFEVLSGHPLIGHSWEGFIIEQILLNLSWKWQYYYFRTAAGNEIDLVLIPPNHSRPLAIEVKYSLSPKINSSFIMGLKDIQAKKGYIIYPGSETIPVENNITIISLSQFLNNSIKDVG